MQGMQGMGSMHTMPQQQPMRHMSMQQSRQQMPGGQQQQRQMMDSMGNYHQSMAVPMVMNPGMGVPAGYASEAHTKTCALHVMLSALTSLDCLNLESYEWPATKAKR